MWIHQLRDDTWELLRWKVEHDAWHSDCDSQVLYGVAQKVREGTQTLGYGITPPAPNRTEQFYKEYIRDVATKARDAIYQYKFRDCTLSEAKKAFDNAAERVAKCSTTDAKADEDQILFEPADD